MLSLFLKSCIITNFLQTKDSIENFKGNKKYSSLYLTANKWLSKNKKTTEVEEPKELLLARKLGLC